MTAHATRQPTRTPAAPARIPRPRTSSLPREPASLAPALPPAFEAFCALHRDTYLDYARAHLPPQQAHHLVCSVLGELAVGWRDIVSNPNPAARAWKLLRTRVQSTAPAPAMLGACPAQQYDALILHCRIGYSSTAAAAVMGLDPSKVRYLVLSATAARRQAVRHLSHQPAASRAA
jgi:rhodanese-related sulfurtransferase